MRHQIAGKRFGRNSSWRKATVRDIAKAALKHQRIRTTKVRAKEARKLVERLISLGKKDTLAAKRKAYSILCDHKLVSDLFTKIATKYKDRAGGYTRIITLPFNRRGDNATLVFLELTGYELFAQKAETKQEEKKPSVKEKTPKATAKPKAEKLPKAVKDKKKPKAADAPKVTEQESSPEEKPKAPKKLIGGIKKIFKKEPKGKE